MSDKKQYERAKELFRLAHEMEQSQREKFLQTACHGDETLLKEVKSLLKFDSPETLIAKPVKLDETSAHLSDSTIQKKSESKLLKDRLENKSFVKLFKDRSRQRLLLIGLASLMVFGLGFLLHQTIQYALKRNLQEGLQAILKSDADNLKNWLGDTKLMVSRLAEDPKFQKAIEKLESIVRRDQISPDEWRELPEWKLAKNELDDLLLILQGFDYLVVDRSGQYLISQEEEKAGHFLSPEYMGLASMAFQGNTKVVFPKPVHRPNIENEPPSVWSVAPIRNAEGDIVAALGVGIPSDTQFARILRLARLGKTGETYAFNSQGYLISESRFVDQLKKIGMLPDKPNATAVFNVQVRDPGVDLTKGEKPTTQLESRPLTVMAASAISGETDFNGDGYRDYRGIKVIGVWTWLPEYSIGVTTEVDFQEAFKPLIPVTWLFWIAAIGLSGVVIGLVMSVLKIEKLEHNIEDMQQLGSYVLEQKIGEGGMGVVYKAKHSLLARPTAIKILKQEQLTDESIARFEREVRLACQLTHPNTIKIYDFGKSNDSLFYYAMEFLPGKTLADIVEQQGPQASQHVIDILIQICKSLHEAHSIGLVHRDIKPRNIMLCDRWGETNVIKVLDFGLAKMVEHSVLNDITSDTVLAGTPQYVAPERFHESAISDPRSDIFSLGAVAYELVTGRKAFDGNQLMDIISKILKEDPPPIEDPNVPEELKTLIFQCLAKELEDRPQSVDEIIDRLRSIRS